MASSGPLYAGTGANFNDGGNTAWSNPTNVQGDTTSTAATVTLGTNGHTSQRLRATNYGFNIPTGATITGIRIQIERQAATANRVRWADGGVQVMKAGTDHSDAGVDTSRWGNTKVIDDLGGDGNMLGATLTPSDVNATGFGVSMKVQRDANSAQQSIFRAFITVFYTTFHSLGTIAVTGAATLTVAELNVEEGGAESHPLGLLDLTGAAALAAELGASFNLGTAPLAGAAALSAALGRTANLGTATLTGAAALDIASLLRTLSAGTVTLEGASALAVAELGAALGLEGATLEGAAALELQIGAVLKLNAALTGSAELLAELIAALAVEAQLTGAAAVDVSGMMAELGLDALDLTGDAVLTIASIQIAGQAIELGVVQLTGDGILSVTLGVTRDLAEVALAGTATITVVELERLLPLAANLTGTAAIDVAELTGTHAVGLVTLLGDAKVRVAKLTHSGFEIVDRDVVVRPPSSRWAVFRPTSRWAVFRPTSRWEIHRR